MLAAPIDNPSYGVSLSKMFGCAVILSLWPWVLPVVLLEIAGTVVSGPSMLPALVGGIGLMLFVGLPFLFVAWCFYWFSLRYNALRGAITVAVWAVAPPFLGAMPSVTILAYLIGGAIMLVAAIESRREVYEGYSDRLSARRDSAHA